MSYFRRDLVNDYTLLQGVPRVAENDDTLFEHSFSNFMKYSILRFHGNNKGNSTLVHFHETQFNGLVFIHANMMDSKVV